MLHQPDRVFGRGNVNIVIYAIIHLNHIMGESNTIGIDKELGTINIQDLVLPRNWYASTRDRRVINYRDWPLDMEANLQWRLILIGLGEREVR